MNKIVILFVFAYVISICLAVKPIDGLKVSGNYLVNNQNQLVILRGTSRSGTEYSCVQTGNIFDGPHDSSVLSAMAAWGINAVRIPLNEQCWLGINGVNTAASGSNYQNAISGWIDTIYTANMAVFLDLHWTAAGTGNAASQAPMPNTDHSLTFWSQVATMFKNRSYVVFEAFNEPYPDNSNWNSTAAWSCWRDGGSCSGISYNVAGMQSIVDTIRETGATNVIALGGIAYSNSLAQWLQYQPVDPLNNLVAVWHTYNFNYCVQQTCWDQTIGVVSQVVPVIATEIGENDCAHGYIDGVMNYLDSKYQNYFGWTWNVWDCGSGPALISDESGTPTSFGVGYKNHILGTTSNFGPVPSNGPFTSGPTRAPSTVPTSAPTSAPNTVYTLSWATSANSAYWSQINISPKPSSVYMDCGYGKTATTIPSWSTTQQDFVLGDQGKACSSTNDIVLYVDNYVLVSKSDGTGINFIAPNTVSYILTWNVSASNSFWSQVDINPVPNVPVYMDCGYFAYPTTVPSWSVNQNTYILGNTQISCTNTTIIVYIGTSNIVSKTDGTGNNVVPSLVPGTASPSSSHATTNATTQPNVPTTTNPTTQPNIPTTTIPTTQPNVPSASPTTQPNVPTTTTPTTQPNIPTTTIPTTQPNVPTTQPTTTPSTPTTTPSTPTPSAHNLNTFITTYCSSAPIVYDCSCSSNINNVCSSGNLNLNGVSSTETWFAANISSFGSNNFNFNGNPSSFQTQLSSDSSSVCVLSGTNFANSVDCTYTNNIPSKFTSGSISGQICGSVYKCDTNKGTPTTKTINTCFYTNTNCSGNSTICTTASLSTVTCNGADPFLSTSNFTFIQSSYFSIKGNSGNYTYYTGSSCTGTPVTVQFQLDQCFTLPTNKRDGSTTSLIFRSESSTIFSSLFLILILIIFSLSNLN
eukprot:TRINITY_DN602_c0_g1_i4.p1 TRINITY_DN602_c0_g1~~TRINITY_DN602_c0_g1_i4.p1  ORF type:complete len:919 (+),score=219.64 TRINITY_DN602_c0_g1_i4:61-2817(+)